MSRCHRLCPSLLWTGAILSILFCCVLWPAAAQETTPVIMAENIAQLGSVAHIDFEGTPIETGWFFMNRTGTRFITHSAYEIYVWSVTPEGNVSAPTVLETKPATLTTATFAPDDTLYGILQGEETTIVRIGTELTTVRTLKDWSPMNLWADEEALWAEAFSEDIDAQEAILRIPYDMVEDIDVLPYTPAEDLDAVVRIGRITTPYTVMSTETGAITVWNLSTGERVYQADTGAGEAAVFGAINTPVTHLTWRDTESETLYRLDLETDENIAVDRLDGDYIQWLFLTPSADVILGVDKEFSQHMTAWIVNGKVLDLGPYRPCGRPQPDMALLSMDGTTLAIGCDTGLDIWRVQDE